MGFVAIPWYVLATTGSASLTGVVAALTFAPTVLATFFGGAIVDRLGFRRTSVMADVASGVTVAAIPLLHATVGIELWQLFVLVFLGALFDAPGATARRSLLPDLVAISGTRLERATGINGAIQRGSLLDRRADRRAPRRDDRCDERPLAERRELRGLRVPHLAARPGSGSASGHARARSLSLRAADRRSLRRS